MTKSESKKRVALPLKKRPPKTSPFARAVRVVSILEYAGWWFGETREERRESYATIIKALNSQRPITVLRKAWGDCSCGQNREERSDALKEWRSAAALSDKA